MIRGDCAPMPDWCRGPYAQAIYGAAVVAADRCPGLIWFDSEVAKMAANAGMYCAAYVHAVHEGRPSAELEEMRLVLREMLADFLLLDPEMVDAPGTIRPDGLDQAVARLCDVPELQ
jgi:hypothetical protein